MVILHEARMSREPEFQTDNRHYYIGMTHFWQHDIEVKFAARLLPGPIRAQRKIP